MEKRIPVYIEDEMRRSYMDYAMSVIIGRALPDVRDGLKPVHRRILYAMKELGVEWNKPFKKSARVVGDVIGKYHPHGDMAVYDAIVRMVQDFSLRYPLIDGQGNFGSVDGDPPAAMRYTEVRLARLANELLADIDKDTVDFVPNYDGSLREPAVLPARFPNALVNGSSGIAVGMATNIPPHNMGEVIDATIHLINNPEATVEELMSFLPGPDFPTGGFIYGKEGIVEAYKTGKGIIQLRARAYIETHPRTERQSIIINEIPYMVNKGKLIEKIADLVKNKRVEGISDIRDESDREGMRVVIDLKKDADGRSILNYLFKHTQMQTSFGIIMLAIVDGRPRTLSLKDYLKEFIDFRREVVTRRCLFELKKARERLHILEGLKVALDHLDEVISLIRKASSPQKAKEGLIQRFNLSEAQAQAILDMKLQRLTALEREKIVEEYNRLLKEVARLEEILGNERLLLDIIVEELKRVKEEYGDERRTEIVEKEGEIRVEDTIAEEEMVVTITHSGYIKRTPLALFRAQRRGGKGKMAMGVREEDFVEHLFIASTKDYILFFTDKGRVYWLKVHEIPEAGRVARGKAIVNLIGVRPGEKVTAVLSVREFKEDLYLVMATRRGYVKKTSLSEYSHPRAGGIIAISLEDGDELVSVGLTSGDREVLLATRLGQAIRFHEEQVREMGRVSRGVRGIALGEGDEVIGMVSLERDKTLLTVTEKGYGKRSSIEEYRPQLRGGKGLINIKLTKKNGPVAGIIQVDEDDEIMIVTNRGRIIRTPVKGIPVTGRNTQGVRLIGLEDEEVIVATAKVEENG